MAIAMCEPHEQPVLGATCRAQWEQESSIPPMVLRDPMEQLISSPAPRRGGSSSMLPARSYLSHLVTPELGVAKPRYSRASLAAVRSHP